MMSFQKETERSMKNTFEDENGELPESNKLICIEYMDL